MENISISGTSNRATCFLNQGQGRERCSLSSQRRPWVVAPNACKDENLSLPDISATAKRNRTSFFWYWRRSYCFFDVGLREQDGKPESFEGAVIPPRTDGGILLGQPAHLPLSPTLGEPYAPPPSSCTGRCLSQSPPSWDRTFICLGLARLCLVPLIARSASLFSILRVVLSLWVQAYLGSHDN